MIENPLLEATAELQRRGLFTTKNAEHLAELVFDKDEQALLRIWAVNILTQFNEIEPKLSKNIFAEGTRLLSRYRRLPKYNEALASQLKNDLTVIAKHFQRTFSNSNSHQSPRLLSVKERP